jgi:hypothetical protein
MLSWKNDGILECVRLLPPWFGEACSASRSRGTVDHVHEHVHVNVHVDVVVRVLVVDFSVARESETRFPRPGGFVPEGQRILAGDEITGAIDRGLRALAGARDEPCIRDVDLVEPPSRVLRPARAHWLVSPLPGGFTTG